MTNSTDWNNYYLTKLSPITKCARQITKHLILRIIKSINRERSISSICELGGGNSCFADRICRDIKVDDYHIVDSNALSIKLLETLKLKARLTTEQSDILDPYAGKKTFDLVYSVGLIEHFDPVGTQQAIEAHFARCKIHGYVLITFPTPTWLYRLSRTILEKTKQWSFPDERPLDILPLVEFTKKYGHIELCKINWWIILTQGILLIRKEMNQ